MFLTFILVSAPTSFSLKAVSDNIYHYICDRFRISDTHIFQNWDIHCEKKQRSSNAKNAAVMFDQSAAKLKLIKVSLTPIRVITLIGVSPASWYSTEPVAV